MGISPPASKEAGNPLWQRSFGFDKTRILPDAIFPSVRIAGGANRPSDELLGAFQDVLSETQKVE